MVFFLIYICMFSEFSIRCGFTFRCYLNFKELGAVVDVRLCHNRKYQRLQNGFWVVLPLRLNFIKVPHDLVDSHLVLIETRREVGLLFDVLFCAQRVFHPTLIKSYAELTVN